MKLVTPQSMKASYDLLRHTVFSEILLPNSDRIKFIAKRMPKHHGLYCDETSEMWVDTGTKTLLKLFQIVAHEMIHVALDRHADCDHGEHDDNFKALARIVEHEMGWPKGSV